jgi:hypothetical protein
MLNTRKLYCFVLIPNIIKVIFAQSNNENPGAIVFVAIRKVAVKAKKFPSQSIPILFSIAISQKFIVFGN